MKAFDTSGSGEGVLLGTAPWLEPHKARAHAMKNCVAVIRAITRLLEPELCEKSLVRAKRLEEASARLVALVDADVAAHGGFGPARFALVDVSSLFARVGEMLQDRADQARVALYIQCESCSLLGDEQELEEALYNLVGNALEATPSGGSVFLRGSIAESGEHTWTVRDTGGGMPEDVLRSAGVSPCSRRRGGSGLGLAIAAAVVRAHGGVMRVETAAGAGTTITAWLPGNTDERRI